MSVIKTLGEKRIKEITNFGSGQDGDPSKFAAGDVVYYKPAEGTASFRRRNGTGRLAG